MAWQGGSGYVMAALPNLVPMQCFLGITSVNLTQDPLICPSHFTVICAGAE